MDRIFKRGIFPSPLLVEGADTQPFLSKMAELALHPSPVKAFHPDLIRFSGDQKIDDLRDLMAKLRQRPYMAPRRVLLLENFDSANSAVQNALLKTLEEPLSYWVVGIGVRSRFSLLETFRSRCLLWRLPAQPPEPLSDHEEEIFKNIAEGKELLLYQEMDACLRDKAKARQLIIRLLNVASDRQYPGYWKYLGPQLETYPEILDRNLNARMAWDRAWAASAL